MIFSAYYTFPVIFCQAETPAKSGRSCKIMKLGRLSRQSNRAPYHVVFLKASCTRYLAVQPNYQGRLN